MKTALFHFERASKEIADQDKKNKIKELIEEVDKKPSPTMVPPVNRLTGNDLF